MTTKYHAMLSIAVAGFATSLYSALLLRFGVVDRETSYSSWRGLPTTSSAGYHPIEYLGIPVFQQFQGLGNRLPLVAGLSNSPLAIAALRIDIDTMRVVLLIIATFIGLFSFMYATCSAHSLQVTRHDLIVPLFCVFPLVAIGFIYSIKNDWSDVALGFWGAIITTFCLVRVAYSERFLVSELGEVLGLLSFGFLLVSMSYPWNWTVYVPVTVVLYGVVIRRILVMKEYVWLAVLLPLAFFLAAMALQSIDIWIEYVSQRASLQPRELELSQLQLPEFLLQILRAQLGWMITGREPYLGVLPVIIVLLYRRLSPTIILGRELTVVGSALVFILLSFTLFSKLPLFRVFLPSSSNAFRDLILPILLFLVAKASQDQSHEPNQLRIKSHARLTRRSVYFCLTCCLVLPMASVTANLGTGPRLNDPVVEQLDVNSYGTIERKSLVYVNRNQWIGADTSRVSLGPQQMQSAGIASVNVVSKMRNSQVLTPQTELFEGGILENHCIWLDSARFLHIDFLVGTQLCENSEMPSDFPTQLSAPLWADVVDPAEKVSLKVCPLLFKPCLRTWTTAGVINLRDAESGDFFHRCLRICVAEFHVASPGSHLLLPLGFDKTLAVETTEGRSLALSEFAGLALLDTSDIGSNLRAKVRIEVDPRMKALVLAAYLKILLMAVPFTVFLFRLASRSRKEFRRLTVFMK